MTSVESQDRVNTTDVRDAFTIHAFLQRSGSKNTYNEVREAVTSSPRSDVMDWSSDAIAALGLFVILWRQKSQIYLQHYVPLCCLAKRRSLES